MVSIRTNTAAQNAQRNISVSQQYSQKISHRLASGSRINSATDDAAGLQLSNRLSQQILGLDISRRNADEGISIMQTAESAMKETTSMLEDMRDLSLQASNASYSDHDRSSMQIELSTLNDEINHIATNTAYAGKPLLDGTHKQLSFQLNTNSGEATAIRLRDMHTDSAGMTGVSYTAETKANKDWVVNKGRDNLVISYSQGGKNKQIAIHAKDGDNIEELATYINGRTNVVKASVNQNGQLQIYTAEDGSQSSLSFSGNLANALNMGHKKTESVNNIDISTVGGAQIATGVIDTALGYVANHRSELGATQNQFNFAIHNMNNMSTNISDSNRRITDSDYAKLTTGLVRDQMMQQMGTSVLAQAKKTPETALSLLS